MEALYYKFNFEKACDSKGGAPGFYKSQSRAGILGHMIIFGVEYSKGCRIPGWAFVAASKN